MRAAGAREHILLEMDAAHARVQDAIAGLTDEQMSRPELDGWSVNDHLTHITFWHEMRFFEVSRIARGGGASFPPVDEEGVEKINEQFVTNRRSLTSAQVIADFDFAREMVRQAIITCPEDRLDDQLYEEIGQHGSGHDSSHAEMIRSWRDGVRI